MSEKTLSYWETAGGRARVAQGARPVPERELRFYEELPTRIAEHRAFRESHGRSTYQPLTPAEEAQAIRAADQELRRATARGLTETTFREGEAAIIANRMRLMDVAGKSVVEAYGPGDGPTSYQLEGYRRMHEGSVMGGVAGPDGW